MLGLTCNIHATRGTALPRPRLTPAAAVTRGFVGIILARTDVHAAPLPGPRHSCCDGCEQRVAGVPDPLVGHPPPSCLRP
eukprot:scaffold6447_cov161-Prasinococcus_capsulatus_cf.AAC.1